MCMGSYYQAQRDPVLPEPGAVPNVVPTGTTPPTSVPVVPPTTSPSILRRSAYGTGLTIPTQ